MINFSWLYNYICLMASLSNQQAGIMCYMVICSYAMEIMAGLQTRHLMQVFSVEEIHSLWLYASYLCKLFRCTNGYITGKIIKKNNRSPLIFWFNHPFKQLPHWSRVTCIRSLLSLESHWSVKWVYFTLTVFILVTLLSVIDINCLSHILFCTHTWTESLLSYFQAA